MVGGGDVVLTFRCTLLINIIFIDIVITESGSLRSKTDCVGWNISEYIYNIYGRICYDSLFFSSL